MGRLGPRDLWEPHTKKLSFYGQSHYKDILSNFQQGCWPAQVKLQPESISVQSF
jgi:hypothetical protein